MTNHKKSQFITILISFSLPCLALTVKGVELATVDNSTYRTWVAFSSAVTFTAKPTPEEARPVWPMGDFHHQSGIAKE